MHPTGILSPNQCIFRVVDLKFCELIEGAYYERKRQNE